MLFYVILLAILAVYNVALSVIVLKLIPLCLPIAPEDKKLPILKRIARSLSSKKRGRPRKEPEIEEVVEPKRDNRGAPVEEF